MIKVKVEGLQATVAHLQGQAKQVKYAASRALTSMAFKGNAAIKNEMQSKFKGGATRYTLAAFKVEKATPSNLTATVSLRTDSPGKSRPYDKAIGHLFTGGTRRWKRMEGAFRAIGVLKSGDMMAVPKEASWANPLDGFGNPRASFIVQLISYFNAQRESGFRSNMTDKRRASLAKRGQSESGYKTINGVVYFISRGPGMWFGRQQRLAAGIWAKRGTHGSDVAPVFLFVSRGAYGKLIDLDGIGRRVVSSSWQSEFNKELVVAMRNAK